MLDDWTWLNLLGGLAQIVGLLVAMRGVRRLKADAFPDEPSPATTLAKRVGGFVWYRVLRRPRPPIVIELPTIESQSMVGTPLITAVAQRPSSPANVEEVLDYIEKVRDAEARQRDYIADKLNQRCDNLRDRIRRNERSTDERLVDQEQRLTLALGGRNGGGLDTTWLGLVIAAFGLATQGAAIILA